MAEEDNKIWYSVGADTSGLNKDLEKAKSMFKGLSDTTQSEGMKMDNMLGKIAASVGVAFTAQQAYQFAKSVAEVRGQFQQLEAAFKTMLGSKAQSDQLMSQLIKTAATTPFQLTEVATGAKSLLAYGTSAEKVNETLKMLGNVASGMNIPLSDMVYLYGTTQVQGRLYAQDMRQFLGRGIPLVEELSKQFGVNKDKISDMVTAGKIGFPEVEKAFQSMTGQGGKFYNMMDSQSKTITGQISNLKDAYDEMLNSMGKESEGVISATIGGAKTIIENYETIGGIIAGLVAVYGTYKAAVIATNAAHEIAVGIKIANAVAGVTLTSAELAGQAATNLWTMAQIKLNAAMLTNPYVLAATAIVGTVAAIILLTDHTTSAERAQKMYDDEVKQTTDALEKHRQEVDKNIETATNMALTDTQRAGAINRLRKEYPDILKKYDLENLSLAEKLRLIKEINEAQGNKAVVANTKKVENTDAEINRLKKENETKTNYDIEKYGRIQSGTRLKIQSNEKAIQDLQKLRVLQTQNVESDNVNKWTANLKNMTDAQIQAQLNERTRMLHELSKKGDTAVGEIKGIGWFRADELKNQNAALEAELANRRKVVVQDKAFWEDQKKKAQETQDTLGQDQINGKEWKTQQKLIDEADKHLRARSTKATTKNKIDADKRVQEQADAAIKETNLISKSGLDKLQKQLDNQKALDNLLEDGFAKKKALIDDDHKQELLNLDKQAQEMLEKQQETERLAWEKGGSKGVFKPTSKSISDLTTENKDILKASTTVVEITYKSNSDKLVKELKDKYASFDEKRREIDKQYLKDETAIKSMFSGDDLNVRLDELNRQHKSAIEANDKEEAESVLKNTELFIQLFGDMSDKSIEDIRKIANESEALFDYLRATSVKDITPNFGLSADQLISLKLGKSEMKSIEDQIKSINSTADSLETGFAKIGTGIRKLFEGSSQKTVGKAKVKSGQYKIDSGIPELVSEGKKEVAIGNKDQLDGLAKEKEGLDALQESFQTVSYFAGQAQGLLNAMSNEEGDAASSAAKSIGAVMDVANSTMEGFKQGGYIGAGIALATSVATKIFESEKAHQAALKKLQDEKIAQQKEYNDLLMKQNELLNEAVTIFGTDRFGQAIGYAQVADKLRNASRNANADLSGATVQTGSHKTGLFGWGGEKSDYSSLLKTYPALIDAQGNLNKELAQSVLDNKTLNETSKKALQSALDYANDYEDALKSLSDYLTDIFGSLGQDMMTTITDNLGDTQSALDDFADSAANTIEKLMTDIAYSMFLADKFTKLSDSVKAIIADKSLSPQDQAAKETALLADFYANIGADVEAANKFLQNSKDAAAKAGFDLWDETTREASTKGFASMSQDSADELNGRFTAIQGHTYSINETLKSMAVNSAAMLNHLSNIDSSTNRLGTIEQFMNEVRAGINQINTKGINIKV